MLKLHSKINHPTILVGDFNMPTLEIKSYLSRHFPDWYVGYLGENVYTWSKGSKSSCIDHIIYKISFTIELCLNMSIILQYVLLSMIFLIINPY